MKNATIFIAACAMHMGAKGINDRKIRFLMRTGKTFACLGLWLCSSAFQAASADTKSSPSSTASATVTRWTCNAFYLPARNIWQRTVAVEYQGDTVRSVQIDDVAVHSFMLEGSTLLTGVDGERIQFDVADLRWTSDMRGLATSSGRCAL